MYRKARTHLEEQGLMAGREEHKNGARWVFRAEEPETTGRERGSKRKPAGSAVVFKALSILNGYGFTRFALPADYPLHVGISGTLGEYP